MSLSPESFSTNGAKIKVVGIGGGGTNAVSTMIKAKIEGVDFVAANTDLQSLNFSLAAKKIQVGKELTKGLGAGADPNIGRDAALEDRHELQEAVSGADMVFVTAGMGGGTGTGGASVVSQIAREQGALTVGVVTKPFLFEGKRRKKFAEMGVEKLREHVDTLIVIPNQRLLQLATPDLSMIDAFKLADNVLVNAVRGISDIINVPGTINVDFADVKTIMSSMGQALMGIGYGTGPNRAVEAANQAISSPLLEDIDIEGATGILINITAGTNISLIEVNEACSIIQDAAHEDANIIFGAVIDDKVGDEIRVTVIATGFPVEEASQHVKVSQKTIETEAAKERRFGDQYISHSPKPHVEEEKVSEETINEPQRVSASAKNESEELTEWTLGHFEPAVDAVVEEKQIEDNSPKVFSGNIASDDKLDSRGSTIETTDPNFNITEIVDEIDKSIDAAISNETNVVSEKEASPYDQNNKEDEADLQIPTFLRNPSKELNY